MKKKRKIKRHRLILLEDQDWIDGKDKTEEPLIEAKLDPKKKKRGLFLKRRNMKSDIQM